MSLLENKIAMVSSCTRGIGLACAEKLADNGAKVYLAVRRLDAGREIADKIIAKGGQADVCYFDAAKPETFRTSVQEVIDKEGRIDILMNNYGSTNVKKDFDLLNTSTDDFMSIVDDNLRSVYDTCQVAVGSMVKTGGGSIINLASVGGKYPDVSRIAYGEAKSAIIFLTENIATQYAKYNVRANCILPGFIATDASMKNMTPEFLSSFLKAVPLNRPGQPEDVANTCLYLASDMSSFVTGQEIPVSGGFGLPSPMYPMYADMQSKG